ILLTKRALGLRQSESKPLRGWLRGPPTGIVQTETKERVTQSLYHIVDMGNYSDSRSITAELNSEQIVFCVSPFQAKIYFSFPGELLMRMLKMLILPLITSSLMSGLSAMDTKASGRLGVLTITYYLWTTFIAVIVGIILVLVIHPGTGTEKDGHRGGSGPVMTSADALLDLIRNMIPSNLIEATFQQYRTDLVPIVASSVVESQANYVYVMPDHNNPQLGHPVFLEITPAPDIKYKIVPGHSSGMNVLGIVIFSATMGLLLGKMGERGAPLVNVCQCVNECVMKIINAAMYFPFGIVFLVAGKILDMHDPAHLGEKLGMYFITVLAGLFVHGLILLPLFYFIITRKNPFTYIRGLLQALVIALATSSSSATLPITMKCLLENCGVDRQIARFVLPVGATINMDGTALYEAVAAIFIAQVNEYELDFGQLVTISITATAASIGAAGIPQAGLVTMVIVLTSVGLPPSDITLIVAIDWVLDRFRTMINVLGDALAAGIMCHLSRLQHRDLSIYMNIHRVVLISMALDWGITMGLGNNPALKQFALF
uniref:Amino acid transporter n=1 Tax=Hucho hucho TaxID=62062 RepID=A0A4W5MG57_9TELE